MADAQLPRALRNACYGGTVKVKPAPSSEQRKFLIAPGVSNRQRTTSKGEHLFPEARRELKRLRLQYVALLPDYPIE